MSLSGATIVTLVTVCLVGVSADNIRCFACDDCTKQQPVIVQCGAESESIDLSGFRANIVTTPMLTTSTLLTPPPLVGGGGDPLLTPPPLVGGGGGDPLLTPPPVYPFGKNAPQDETIDLIHRRGCAEIEGHAMDVCRLELGPVVEDGVFSCRVCSYSLCNE
ncbi:uncharacterized protein LOC131207956 [Anopheles bellator]|uniref:uncharacterized protein LOC131207956 n=1 Tax=Anopheles bellator TaxID=139047 RepID=UPI002649B49F|nr:uncharacterized protein LOC131207956 [Anopheles bellator]